MSPQIALAAGTTAGTNISNVVTLNYAIAGTPAAAISSNTIVVVVDELIQLTLTWQDGSPVPVTAPSSNAPLTFLLTNVGNGQEAFSLVRANNLAGDDYDPLDGSIGSIYLESGAQPGFQASGIDADSIYTIGVNDPDLAPDVGMVIYVVSDTPAVGNGANGDVQLSAAATTPGAAGAAPGTSWPSLGQGGNFAVVGVGSAQASATGRYFTSSLGLGMTKSVISTLDPNGGTVKMPGAIVTYQITTTVSGVGTANGLVITDPIPAEMTYLPSSIEVGGVAKTDSNDVDNAEFITGTQTVSVSLGNVSSSPPVVITFRATIN